MQAELDTLVRAPGSGPTIRILGVNGIGLESGNEGMCAGRTIPWLQDVAAQDVWTKWAVEYRDVVVLDAQNRPVAVYNLTVHDLADSDNYRTLRDLLLQKASE